ncbi:hypothetical protein Q3G72_027511 [Acer saccharum]|nr:hypothetical protein Q3G72_027511 [Acer saccharum]
MVLYIPRASNTLADILAKKGSGTEAETQVAFRKFYIYSSTPIVFISKKRTATPSLSSSTKFESIFARWDYRDFYYSSSELLKNCPSDD